MDTTVRTWLDAALRQMAAECYLDGIDFQNETQIAIRLQAGNNDIRNSNIAALDPNNLPGKTRFTDEQIKYFNETWQIVDHRPDLDDRFATRGIGNGTGFSATLCQFSLKYLICSSVKRVFPSRSGLEALLPKLGSGLLFPNLRVGPSLSKSKLRPIRANSKYDSAAICIVTNSIHTFAEI